MVLNCLLDNEDEGRKFIPAVDSMNRAFRYSDRRRNAVDRNVVVIGRFSIRTGAVEIDLELICIDVVPELICIDVVPVEARRQTVDAWNGD